MKKTAFLLIAFFAIGIFCQDSIMAQKRGNRFENIRDFHPGNPLEMVDLTDEQENTISELRYEHQMQAIELKSKLKQNRLKLEKLFENENVDESEVMGIVEQNNDIHAQLSNMRMDMRLKINSLLTPEQREQIKEQMKNRPGFGMWRDNDFEDRNFRRDHFRSEKRHDRF